MSGVSVERAIGKRRSHLCRAALLSTLAMGATASFGQGFKIAQVNPPTAVSSMASGINVKGKVVGSYQDSTLSTFGFATSGGKYLTLTFPGSNGFTRAGGINDSGTIAGDYLGFDNFYHGYTWSNGVFTQYDVNDGVVSTSVFGINNAGTLVGAAGFQGFITVGGVATLYNAISNNNLTYPYAVNNSNQSVGEFFDSGNKQHGFYRDAKGKVTQVDYPGSTLTICEGINDAGEISGLYNDSNQVSHGFTYTAGKFLSSDLPAITGINNSGSYLGYYYAAPFVNGFAQQYGYVASSVSTFKFTTLAVPKALSTSGFDVSDSDVFVGQYTNSLGVSHGLQATVKSLKNIDDPKAEIGTTACEAINASGVIVGYYKNSSGLSQAFEYSKGVFTDLGPAGAAQSAAYGINDSGEVSGLFVDSAGAQHGFLLAGAVYTTLDVPGATASLAWGVNNSGSVAMQWVNAAKQFESAIYNGTTYTTIDVPGFISSYAHGIDKAGDVVYSVQDLSGSEHGAVLRGGTYYFFDDPAGTTTRADGINDSGLIVGRFLLSDGINFDAFDATF